MNILSLNWIKCDGQNWCNLLRVDLANKHFNDLNGVYIIWAGDQVIRLGSGTIKDRLYEHKNNSEITQYPNLKVTWAKINGNQMQGVEKYLASKLPPVIGDRFPENCSAIEVNLPPIIP